EHTFPLLLNKELMFGYNNIIKLKGAIYMDGLLIRSIEENIPLEMIYLAENQELSQRSLIVKEISDEYIRAYCLLRKQIRTFRRANILSIMPESCPKNSYLH
ncbi:hypothetical protein V7161_28855, partial [Neobacillus drentensis]|uniref:hypothetical protein n=1 Tax=Neobacillus drentensis TaxID=220684 RepID=UPI00300187EC